jgi:hypothetical protein
MNRCNDLDERRGDKPDKIRYFVPGHPMKHELFTRVALKADLPEHGLCCGDVATVVELHSGRPNQEPGYSLEVFNAVGDTIAVVTVRESQIGPLTSNQLLHVRPLAEAAK